MMPQTSRLWATWTRNFSTLMPPARLWRNTWQQGSFTSQWGPKSNIPWVNHLKQRGSLMEMHPDPHSKTYDALNLKTFKNIFVHEQWSPRLRSTSQKTLNKTKPDCGPPERRTSPPWWSPLVSGATPGSKAVSLASGVLNQISHG